MKGCYVSPFGRVEVDYRKRDAEQQPITRWVHAFPQPGGQSWVWCNRDPKFCRECHREETIHDHGEADAAEKTV